MWQKLLDVAAARMTSNQLLSEFFFTFCHKEKNKFGLLETVLLMEAQFFCPGIVS
jgi:hypothetical protein